MNMDYRNKKNEFIKNFLTNTINNNNHLKLAEEIKKLKEYYDNRALLQQSKTPKINSSDKSDNNNSTEKKQEIDNLDKEKELININEENENNKIIENKKKNNKKNNKKIFYIGIFPKIREIEKNIKKQNIPLLNEEEKQNNIINEKNKNIDNELSNECNDDDDLNKKSFCNKKRNREKIKYFLICKNDRKIGNDIKSKFFVNKRE